MDGFLENKMLKALKGEKKLIERKGGVPYKENSVYRPADGKVHVATEGRFLCMELKEEGEILQGEASEVSRDLIPCYGV